MELKITDLKKTYGNVKALKGINYTFTPGVYGILGANGAGKSTMINLITDNVSRDKNGGSIMYSDGEDNTVSKELVDILKLGAKFRGVVGYMPQQQGFYEEFSPKAFLKYMAEIKGVKSVKSVDEAGNVTIKKVNQQIDELLEVVNLTSVAYKKIGGFSGGMKQRLGIAQAMLNNPRILILDEPTAGLDPKERVRFRNLISAFSKDRIVILSTHIVSDVEFIAEDIIMMKDGQILHFGKTQEITTEIDGQVWECTVPTSRAEQYSETLNISNLRNIENNCTVLRVISEQSPMENAIKVEPTLEDLYLFYFKGVNE